MKDKAIDNALRLASQKKVPTYERPASSAVDAHKDAVSLLRAIDNEFPHLSNNYKKGGKVQPTLPVEPEPGSDAYWNEKHKVYAVPYEERVNNPRDPMRYISPLEYKRGNMGRGEYVMSRGGRTKMAVGGDPLDQSGNPVVTQSNASNNNPLSNTPIPDATQSYIQSLYKNVLGREADQPGLDYWSNQLRRGDIDQAQALQQFAGSQEFGNLYKSDPSKAISSLYQTALDRAPDQSGLDFWTQQAQKGLALPEMVGSFTGSKEGQVLQDINNYYRDFTNSMATPEQMASAKQLLGPNQDWNNFLQKAFPDISGETGSYNIAQNWQGLNSQNDTTPSSGVGEISFAPERRITGIVNAGPGATTVQYDDGSIETRKGDFAWRQNNPGNIKYNPDPNWWGHKYGAMPGGKAVDGGRISVFPSVEQGNAAREELLFESPAYKNLSVVEAIKKYAPPKSNRKWMSYAQGMADAAGVDLNTKMGDFTFDQRKAAMESQIKSEGNRKGKIIQVKGATTTPPQETDPGLTKAAADAAYQQALEADKAAWKQKRDAYITDRINRMLPATLPPELQNYTPGAGGTRLPSATGLPTTGGLPSTGGNIGTTLAGQGAPTSTGATGMVNPTGNVIGAPTVIPEAAWGNQATGTSFPTWKPQGMTDTSPFQKAFTDAMAGATGVRGSAYDPIMQRDTGSNFDPLTGVGLHSVNYGGPGIVTSGVGAFNPSAVTGYVAPTATNFTGGMAYGPPGLFKHGGVVNDALNLAKRKLRK